jgi:hypothetical protein
MTCSTDWPWICGGSGRSQSSRHTNSVSSAPSVRGTSLSSSRRPAVPCISAALDGWIEVRLRRHWGLSGVDEYRGLRPDSKLVTTHKGQAFELAFKPRELDSVPGLRFAPADHQ